MQLAGDCGASLAASPNYGESQTHTERILSFANGCNTQRNSFLSGFGISMRSHTYSGQTLLDQSLVYSARLYFKQFD